MKRISKILLVLLAVAMVFAISACGKKDKVLVMATSADFPPYEYMEDGKFAGIDVEIAQAIAAELGMELKIENMEFKGVITAVASGKADIGMAGLTVERIACTRRFLRQLHHRHAGHHSSGKLRHNRARRFIRQKGRRPDGHHRRHLCR